MKRRDLLKAGTVGVGAAAVNALPGWAQAGGDAGPDCRVDVLVIGGGTAGTIAALQAARAGARTMLVEMGSQLGGTMTTGGVWWPGLFHAWEKQVIAGIGWELVSKTVALDGGTMPDFATPAKHHWEHQVPINGLLYAALAEEACLAAGLMLCYYEFPLSVAETGDGWLVETVGKGIRRRIACRQLIDCTGGADVVGMIGLPRLREAETQPGTLVFRFGGYDVKTLDADRIDQRYREALAKGELSEGDYSETNGRFIHFLQTAGVAHHVFLADSSTSATKTATNLAGRASMLRLLRFVRSLPGCERTTLTRMHPETAVRETFRIVGEVQITQEDYTNGRVFNDAIGYTFYPIDVHGRSGVNPQPLKRGVVPTLPLGALIPKGSRNLLVAGRSISSDRLANSALRVQASCMAMGQAAGAAAALAASQERTPAKVPIDAVRDVLRKHGAILPA